MKRFLTVVAALTVFATLAFAQAFVPSAGNLSAFSQKLISRLNGDTALSAYSSILDFNSVANPNGLVSTGGVSFDYDEMSRN
jgi:hypothetical protein